MKTFVTGTFSGSPSLFRCCSALIAGWIVLGIATSAVALPLLPNDHLLGYKVKPETDATPAGTKFPKDVTASLHDDFSPLMSCGIIKEKLLYNPADKSNEGIWDITRHFVAYQVKCLVNIVRTRTYFDQFSPAGVSVTFSGPKTLLVPSGKSTLLTSDPTTPPAGTDHYLCYKAKAENIEPVSVRVDDQFGSRSLRLTKIDSVCNPADVNGEDPLSTIGTPDHYVCYKGKADMPAASPVVRTNNREFGANTLEPGVERILCVPAFEGFVLPECGNGAVEDGEQCETNSDCGASEVCSSGCNCIDDTCPGSVEWTRFAGEGLGSTVTDRDLGWVGAGHNADISDASKLVLRLDDPWGSGPSSCGLMDVLGIDAASGNCRCASDNRTICDEPFELDSDDCAGVLCKCYLTPPEPIHAGAAYCVISRLESDVTGTWDVDSGAAQLSVREKRRYYSGASQTEPCPYCSGDPTANDRVRGGTCVGGANDGRSCDAHGLDATFPVTLGEGAYSYDCFPSNGLLVNGDGSRVAYELQTGTSSVPAALDCAITGLCPCGVCEQIPNQVGCSSNADCADETPNCSGSRDRDCTNNLDCQDENVGPCLPMITQCQGAIEIDCTTNDDCLGVDLGTCAAPACTADAYLAAAPEPNDCTTGVCLDAGGGEGECDDGPDDMYCDGYVRENGDGIYSCNCNTDCFPSGGGNCTITERRRCFLDPVSATGMAFQNTPVLAASSCHPPTTSAFLNATGFPGPQRLKIAGITRFRCAGNPASFYPDCP